MIRGFEGKTKPQPFGGGSCIANGGEGGILSSSLPLVGTPCHGKPLRRLSPGFASLTRVAAVSNPVLFTVKINRPPLRADGFIFYWRRRGDSNPRYRGPVYQISSLAHSTTLPPLQVWAFARSASVLLGKEPRIRHSWCPKRESFLSLAASRLAAGDGPGRKPFRRLSRPRTWPPSIRFPLGKRTSGES